MIATVRGVIAAASFITLPTLVIGGCVLGVAVVVLFTQLRNVTRRTGRHRRVGTRRLLPADTEVSAVVDNRIWRGVAQRPATGADHRSCVFPVRFSFGVRLMCAEDVTLVTDPALAGAR